MGAPLRKSQLIANDFYETTLPEALPAPVSPRLVPYVRLAPVPQPQRHFSAAIAFAAIFVAGTIALLGAMVLAMLWFGRDGQNIEPRIAASTVPVVAAPVMPAEETPVPKAQEKPVAKAQPVKLTPPPAAVVAPTAPVAQPKLVPADPNDIMLPAEGLPPQPSFDASADAAPADAAKANDLQMSIRDAQPDEADTPAAASSLAMEAHGMEKQGKLKPAIAQLARAAKTDPDNLLYRLDLAMLYDRAGQERDALALYRQVLDAAESEGLQAGGKNFLPPETINAIRTRVGYFEGLERE